MKESLIAEDKEDMYISIQEYFDYLEHIQKRILRYRKQLLELRSSMKNLSKNNKTPKERYKALGYINAIDYIDKKLIRLADDNYGRKINKDN